MNRQEIWLPVKDYINYEVSNFGKVRSLNYHRTGKVKVLKLIKNKKGYLQVVLCKNGKQKRHYVHRLVWETFVGKIPEGYELDHIDGNPQNNRLENLRVVTHKQNFANPITKQRHTDACRAANKKRCSKSVIQIDKQTGETIKRFECAMDASRELGISFGNVSACCNGKKKSAGGFIWRFFMPPACIS